MSIDCSRITKVNVDVLSRIRTACHNNAKGIELVGTLNLTYKHAAEFSKLPVWI